MSFIKMEKKTAISIKNLVKSYNGYMAVKGINLDIQEGEFFGFLGPNGAGKTSTINSMVGISNFDSGKIEIFGHDVVNDYRNARGFIGLAPQEFNFDPFLNTNETLIYQAGYYGIKKRNSEKKATELLKLFGIYDKLKSDIRSLSGGMKRRLNIARALMHSPKILILDEPTSGVDVELRYFIWDFLRKLNESGTTIFLTTHYIEEVEKLCDRVCILNHGEIIEMDDKKSLIKRFSKSHIEITLKNEIKELPLEIKNFNYNFYGNKIVFIEEKKDIKNLLHFINKTDLKIADINIRDNSLEDIFMQVVKNRKQ